MISFIIPLFNHLNQSKEMLASLLTTIPLDLDYEIIMIDDGSTDGTQAWLHSLTVKNLHVMVNESNLGYAKSNNKAIYSAKGDILVLLNNDLILLPVWLEPMLEVLGNPILQAGIVGNIQQRVTDNSLDHAGIYVNHLAKIEHIREISVPYSVYSRVFAVTGACCLLFRQDFLAVGGFDEQFQNGGEDVDLCLKLSARYKYAYVSNISTVKHHVSLTRGTTSLVNEKNSQLLFLKWRLVIFQQVKNAWLQLLRSCLSVNTEIASQYYLKPIYVDTPHVAAIMLSNSVMLREEIRWQEILDDHHYIINNTIIEQWDGFYWNSDHSLACSYKQSRIVLAKNTFARNIVISGEMVADELSIIVDINGLQERRWENLPIGHFNLTIENPVLSWHCESIISITLDLKSNDDSLLRQLSTQAYKLARFSQLSIDGYVVIDFNRVPLY